MLTDSRLVQTRTTTYRLSGGESGRIDLITVSNDGSSHLRTRGLFSLRGDDLTYCIGKPETARPTEFSTNYGDGRTLVVLRRKEPVRKTPK